MTNTVWSTKHISVARPPRHYYALFDGSTQGLAATDLLTAGGAHSAFTISFWFAAQTAGAGTTRDIWGARNRQNVEISSGNLLRMTLGPQSGDNVISRAIGTEGTDFNYGEWSHAVASYEVATERLVSAINGVTVKDETVTPGSASFDGSVLDLSLGASATTLNNKFPGAIAELCTWYEFHDVTDPDVRALFIRDGRIGISFGERGIVDRQSKQRSRVYYHLRDTHEPAVYTAGGSVANTGSVVFVPLDELVVGASCPGVS